MLYTDIKVIENRVENKMFYATVFYVMLLRMRVLWYAIICSCYGVKFQCNCMRLQWYAMLQCTCLLYAVKQYLNELYYTSITWSKKTVYNKEFYAVVKQL